MVFEGAFEKIFSIIKEEGGSEGGVVVQVIFFPLNFIVWMLLDHLSLWSTLLNHLYISWMFLHNHNFKVSMYTFSGGIHSLFKFHHIGLSDYLASFLYVYKFMIYALVTGLNCQYICQNHEWALILVSVNCFDQEMDWREFPWHRAYWILL